jgi:hypothetical protein
VRQANPNLFPVPVGGVSYSRFAAGEIGSDIVNPQNAKKYQGSSPLPQAAYQIAPGYGSPVPAAFSGNQANAIGPGVASGVTPNG